MINKIALMGDKDSIIGFKLLGVDLYPIKKTDEAINLLNKISKENYAVIFITEDIAKDIIEVINEYQRVSKVSFTVLPEKLVNRNIGLKLLKKNIEKAIGKDILFGKEGE